VSRRRVRLGLHDPYADAFGDGPVLARGESADPPAPGPWVWVRKYEPDSPCAPPQSAYALWRATGRTDTGHLDDAFG
jgi:meiotically up-regulated gene 157 (Mug157) protein